MYVLLHHSLLVNINMQYILSGILGTCTEILDILALDILLLDILGLHNSYRNRWSYMFVFVQNYRTDHILLL